MKTIKQVTDYAQEHGLNILVDTRPVCPEHGLAAWRDSKTINPADLECVLQAECARFQAEKGCGYRGCVHPLWLTSFRVCIAEYPSYGQIASAYVLGADRGLRRYAGYCSGDLDPDRKDRAQSILDGVYHVACHVARHIVCRNWLSG